MTRRVKVVGPQEVTSNGMVFWCESMDKFIGNIYDLVDDEDSYNVSLSDPEGKDAIEDYGFDAEWLEEVV